MRYGLSLADFLTIFYGTILPRDPAGPAPIFRYPVAPALNFFYLFFALELRQNFWQCATAVMMQIHRVGHLSNAGRARLFCEMRQDLVWRYFWFSYYFFWFHFLLIQSFFFLGIKFLFNFFC